MLITKSDYISPEVTISLPAGNCRWGEMDILFKEYLSITEEIEAIIEAQYGKGHRKSISSHKIGEIKFSDTRLLPDEMRRYVTDTQITKIEGCVLLSEFTRLTTIPSARAEEFFKGRVIYRKQSNSNKIKKLKTPTKSGKKRKNTVRSISWIVKLPECIADAFRQGYSLYYLGTEKKEKGKRTFSISEKDKKYYDKIIKVENSIVQRNFYFGAW